MSEAADRVDQEVRGRAGAPGTHPELDRLVRTMWRLRQPDGCPWDREQTHLSITRNMVEEAYEAVEAIHEGSCEHVLEELGDVLEQVVLHAQIAADDGEFDIDDVAHALNEKLVRRHPHVFGDVTGVSDGEAVMDVWDDVKRAEREAAAQGDEAPRGLLDSVPASLPALMQAQKISKRAAKAGFEWPDLAGVWGKVSEERAEFEAEEPGSPERAEEFGDLLFSLVNVARWEHIDAEGALASANRKFRSRWARMERLARERGVELESLGAQELDDLWGKAKLEERGERGRA